MARLDEAIEGGEHCERRPLFRSIIRQLLLDGRFAVHRAMRRSGDGRADGGGGRRAWHAFGGGMSRDRLRRRDRDERLRRLHRSW